MIISVNTKIAAILRYKPDALEAIVSISPKFEKLRNPLLRKVIAGRTSIAMASRIGGCHVDDFFNKLYPFGFQIDKSAVVSKDEVEIKPVPDFFKTMNPDIITELDVRKVIEKGNDPLNIILNKVTELETGRVLKIIHSFEPIPLMHLLRKQGFESYTETISDELVYAYFYKKTSESVKFDVKIPAHSAGWDEILIRFNKNLETIDVRALEMPLPMHNILDALEALPEDKALFVKHKRIPVFLLPELEERKFSYRIKEINVSEVHLLIYRD
ncbi:MAG: DUF2249 domain-containing protein [Bacteroidota bacterium]|nr:DUF2249 domain-containing protein [Bacteroidota bacterium]